MTVAKKMNDGVSLLLERMKTNPEEFFVGEGVVGKWDSLVKSYESVLPPEDIKAYRKARNVLLQQRFTESVMQQLIEPDDDEYVNIPAQRIPRVKRFAGEITYTSTSNTPIAGVTQTV